MRANTTGKIVIICGSGKQINTALGEQGFYVGYDNAGERVFCSEDSEKIVRKILKQTSDTLSEKLGDNFFVKGAWEEIGGVYCHINADTLIFTYYLGFDQIYIYTFSGNGKKKQQTFANYKKIQIIEL